MMSQNGEPKTYVCSLFSLMVKVVEGLKDVVSPGMSR